MRSTASRGPPAPASAEVAGSRPKPGRDVGCRWIWRTGAASGEPAAVVGCRPLPASSYWRGHLRHRLLRMCWLRCPWSRSGVRRQGLAHGLAPVPTAEIRHSVAPARTPICVHRW